MVPRPGDGSAYTVETKNMCIGDDDSVVRCVILDSGNVLHSSTAVLEPLTFPSSLTVSDLFSQLSTVLTLAPHSFNVELIKTDMPGGVSTTKTLSDSDQSTLLQAGFDPTVDNSLMLKEKLLYLRDRPENPVGTSLWGSNKSVKFEADSKRSSYGPGYLGLVNQAMTCYLNSLLQTLFMTPEFRNALYRWEFDASSGDDPAMSLVHQLQKLFVQLETSSRHSVETTDLTRSFGWASSEVWTQHDIQELCRVMFDTLETKFRGTDQADFIKRLYEGKMLDYLKCLECGTEKAREDIYQDIQLPIRPFNDSTTYSSVEEALKAFVTPEILNESNQYFCEKCNKKCDAHKGLKFKSFPYLLTIQMKRFEYDYNVMHRIKVNDKVSFPALWDLGEFVTDKAEVSSTPPAPNGPMPTSEDVQMTDLSDPAGGDCERGDPMHLATEGKKEEKEEGGSTKHLYELFSVMIHSGSANGGHYYAMIKNLENGAWFCFNDTQVTEVTFDDVMRMYGGMPESYGSRSYGSYSANAYMLMYRLVDKERNANFLRQEDFPPHLCELREVIRQQEDLEEKNKEIERSMLDISVFCHPKSQNEKVEYKMKIHRDQPIREVENDAYERLRATDSVPRNQVRLTTYSEDDDIVETSFEDKDPNMTLGDVCETGDTPSKKYQIWRTFYLEIRNLDEEFLPLPTNSQGCTIWVTPVNLKTEETGLPFRIRSKLDMKISDLKARIARRLPVEFREPAAEALPLVLKCVSGELKRVDREVDDWTLRRAGFYKKNEVFLQVGIDPEAEEKSLLVPFQDTDLFKFLNRISNSIRLRVQLPELDETVLYRLGLGPDGRPIPHDPPPDYVFENGAEDHHGYRDQDPMEQDVSGVGSPSAYGGEDDVVQEGQQGSWYGVTGVGTGTDDAFVEELVRAATGGGQGGGDRSEESSLTDSERTLVGDTEHDGEASSTKGCPGSDQGSNCDSPAPNSFVFQLSPSGPGDGDGDQDPLAFMDSDTAHGGVVGGRHVDIAVGTNSVYVIDPTAGGTMFHDDHQEEDGRSNGARRSMSPPPLLSCSSGSGTVDEATRARDDAIIKNMKVERLSDNILLLDVDRRITVDGMKRALSNLIGPVSVPQSIVHIYRSFSSAHDQIPIEIKGSADDALPCRNEETVSVRLVREIRALDRVGRIYMFKPHLVNGRDNVFHARATPHAKHSELVNGDWVITLGQTVGLVKQYLLSEIKKYLSTKNEVVSLDRIRLRVKSWYNPGNVLFDDQVFVDSSQQYNRSGSSPSSTTSSFGVTRNRVYLSSNWELCFELLSGPEIARSPLDFVAYLRPFHPSVYKFDPVVEFCVPGEVEVTEATVAAKVEEMFGIPVKYVELARPGPNNGGTCLFCERFPSAEVEWFRPEDPAPSNSSRLALKPGTVTYFRDSREKEMTPTDPEMAEMYQEDKIRNLRGNTMDSADVTSVSTSTGTSMSMGTRLGASETKKETGLTIYLDGRKPEMANN